jgi:DNA-directed RNA polymerase specialized sigma subunit
LKKYNDYELLYLIAENNEHALDIMFDKYTNLIKKRIELFKIQSRLVDDFFQEGLLVLDKAIRRFDETYNKTFTRYFDELLQWRFMEILRKEKEYFYNVSLVEDLYYLADEVKFYNEDKRIINVDEIYFSDLEQAVYEYKFLEFKKTKEIMELTNASKKSIYNATVRVRAKLKGLK